MQTIELTEEQVAFNKACAYLKGYIVGQSVKRGMKWESKKEPTESFQAGFDKASERGCGFHSSQALTIAHIIHNRLRHNRPHTKDDDAFISKTRENFYGLRYGIMLLKEDLSEVLSEDEFEKLLEVSNG
jgi:hypothetical protein